MKRVAITGWAILAAVLCAGLMLAGCQSVVAAPLASAGHAVKGPATARGPFSAISALSDMDLTSVLPEPVSIILVGMVLLGCVAIVRRRMA